MHLFRNARVPLACLPAEFSALPADSDVRIEPTRLVDLHLDGDKIVAVRDAAHSVPPAPLVSRTSDLGGALVFPGLLDVHTHLDKAHTWKRSPNLSGEFSEALAVLRDDSARWTEEDVYRRAHFALQRAWAHGTVAIRTHLDTNARVGENAHATMQRLRAEWAPRIAIQTVSLFPFTDFFQGHATRILEISAKYKATALGGFLQPTPELPKQLDSVLAAARELGVGLDFHVDENGDAQAECLRAVAEAVLRHAFPHPVACGHCCSLSKQHPERQRSTIDLVKAAGVQIISLPLCNLYLQGREKVDGRAKTPQWRGITLLHEFLDAGVTVACASDNVRDAFFPWGDLDAMEVYTQSFRIGHLDTKWCLSPSIVTTAPARIMNLPGYGEVAPGARANLIVFQARSFSELFSVPGAPRRLLHGESFRHAQPPSYAELD